MSDEQIVRSLELWLTVWNILVVNGVLLELVDEVPRVFAIWRTKKRIDWITLKRIWTWPSAEISAKYEWVLTLCGVLGTVSIIVGLAGELSIQATLSVVQHNIRVD